MSTTLDDLLQLARQRLEAARTALPDRQLSGSERTALLHQAVQVLRQIDRHVGDFGLAGRYASQASPQDQQAAADLRHTLSQARGAIRRAAAGHTGAPTPPRGASNGVVDSTSELENVHHLLGAAHDMMATHHSVDGRLAASPYGELLTSDAGQRYVTAQMADFTEEIRLLGQAVARSSDPRAEQAGLTLRAGLADLAKTSVDLHLAVGEAPTVIGALTAATHTTPVPVRAGETQADRLTHVTQGADHLQMLAWDGAHPTDAMPPYSAAAMRGSAGALALSHMLTGNAVRAVADHLPADAAPAATEAAEKLRTAARAWQQAAGAWHRIVDLNDGAAQPKHPAHTEAELMTLRLGRLTYTDSWVPQDRPGAPDPERLLVSDVGALLETLRRVPTAAAALAEHAPRIARDIHPHLLTDDGEHAGRRDQQRWFPSPASQLAEVNQAYRTAQEASTAAQTALANLAGQAGAVSKRAALDQAADQARRTAPTLAEQPEVPQQAGWRSMAQAAPIQEEQPTGWRAFARRPERVAWDTAQASARESRRRDEDQARATQEAPER